MNKKSSISLFLAATSALAISTNYNSIIKAEERDFGWEIDLSATEKLKKQFI